MDTTRLLILTALLALVPALASADTAGTPGPIAAFDHNDDSSDFFGLHAGALYIDEGGGTVRQYRWSGSLCTGRDLDTSQQALLLEAARAKWIVLPYYKTGSGNARCLTSFAFAIKKKFVGAVTK